MISEISLAVLPSPVQRSTVLSRSVSRISPSGSSLVVRHRDIPRCATWVSHVIIRRLARSSESDRGSSLRANASKPAAAFESRLDCAQPTRNPNERASSHSSGAEANTSSDQTMGKSDRMP